MLLRSHAREAGAFEAVVSHLTYTETRSTLSMCDVPTARGAAPVRHIPLVRRRVQVRVV